MIKLIASDLDGTLFKPHGVLPDETFNLIERLYEKGITFAPASGRQLPNLLQIFKPVLDKIAIIAENGGVVWRGCKVIYSNLMPQREVVRALDAVSKADELYPLLSCADCAYYQDDNPKFVQTVKNSYTVCKRVKNLKSISGEVGTVKISVWDEYPPCAEHGGIILPPTITGLRTIVSGYDWLDISNPQAHKGRALEELMRELKINRDECEAYGDHMNDFEMLSACGSPFVTANAFAGLKKYFPNELPSNVEMGVIKRLKEILK